MVTGVTWDHFDMMSYARDVGNASALSTSEEAE